MRSLALVLAAALLLPATAEAASRPRYGGEAVLAFGTAPRNLDPARASTPAELVAVSQIHQPPLARGADGSLIPVLLTEIPVSADGRTFRLRLRDGLRFHDGTPLLADDLASSLRRLAGTPWASLSLPVKGISVVSEKEVEVALAVPYPRWPEALAEPGAAVIPAGQRGATPPGAGPFRIAGTAGALQLAAFEDHAAGRPYLDRLRLVAHGDDRAAARALAEGRADLAPRGATGLRGPGFATWLLVSPAKAAAEPVVAGAIDRKDLVRWFVPGSARPMAGVAPGVPASRRSGKGDARGPLTLAYDASIPGHQQVAERIQLRLHDKGVEVRLQAVGAAELRNRTRAGNYELALAQLPLPADPGLAGASVLLASGRADEARRFLAAVGRAGSDLGAARRAAGAAPSPGAIPLYESPYPLAAGSQPRLEGLPEAGASLGSAWRREAR